MNIKIICSMAILLLLQSTQFAQARNFRSMIKIPVAPQSLSNDTKIQQKIFRPVNKALIQKSVRKILNSWNHGDLSKYLADTFQDKNLLLYTIRRSVPSDARLRLLALHGVSTLEQRWVKVKGTKKTQLISVVIATVDIQLEFNDPFNGLVRLPHTSQFYLQVTESE